MSWEYDLEERHELESAITDMVSAYGAEFLIWRIVSMSSTDELKDMVEYLKREVNEE